MSETRRLPLVLTLVAAQLVVMLDSSILNIALPSIADDLDLSAVGTAWVLNAYYLTFGGLLLVSGRAADFFGRRRMFLVGAAVLIAGSVLGGLAPTEGMLIVGRLVQGAGAAMLSPAAMSMILAGFTGEARARTMSWWGAASTIGGAAGVSVGGLLVGGFGWRSVMVVTGVVAAVIGIAGWIVLPRDVTHARRSFDVAGAGLLTVAAVAIVYGVLSAPHAGAASVEVIASAVVAVGAVIGFVLVEARSSDPVLAPSTLREPRVAGGIAVNLLGGAARVACFVLVALLIQQVLEYDPAVAGLAMLPTSLAGFAVSTLLLPRMLTRFGAQKVAVMGLVLLVAAHLMFATVDTGVPYVWRVLPALLVAATGVAFSFTPTTLVIADGMAAQNAGVSSGLASSTAQIGGAIGIAVFGAVDAAQRAAALAGGETVVAAAHAGLSAAHLTAAVTAALGVVVAVASFPALRKGLVGARSAPPRA
jgi:EmrB/QacA subfamily drug resistance transporter